MTSVKQQIIEIVQAQPDDATYGEIMRELAFERMIRRGMEDIRRGRVVSSGEAKRRIRTWRK